MNNLDSSVNPQFPYYCLLFILTVALRFIRAYRGRPKDRSDATIVQTYYLSYSHFGFELVNVSAGIFILLQERATEYVASVTMIYVLLIVISFFAEEDTVGPKLQTLLHLCVSAMVIAVALYAFFFFDGLRPKKSDYWKVAVPYVDTSLNRNYAAKQSPLTSIYTTVVEGKSREAAILAATKQFYGDGEPQPFVKGTVKSPATMVVLQTEAVVEKLMDNPAGH